MNLQTAKVIEIEPVGKGTRVCVDVVDSLEPQEGMLVGNTGHGYLLVMSENRTTDTYPARPFRINGGALHQYVYMGEDKTTYLTEIQPGYKLPIIQNNQVRMVGVGRVKAEKRELIRIVCQFNETQISATFQESDSVHVQTADGAVKSIVDVEVGDTLLCYPDEPGRHLGKKIEEDIWEI